MARPAMALVALLLALITLSDRRPNGGGSAGGDGGGDAGGSGGRDGGAGGSLPPPGPTP
ncbi:MAG: hypothetical protein ACK5QW_11215 [Cyanobacteriota bacterium]